MKKINLKLIIFILIILTLTIIPNVKLAINNTTTTIKVGDVNSDGNINTTDLLLILRHMYATSSNNHSEWTFTQSQCKIADTNKDNKIDTSDLLTVLRYMAAMNDNEIAKRHPNWLKLNEIEKIEEPKTVEVTKIQLNHTKGSIEYGKSFTLQASISPSNATNKRIVWRTSNKNIAMISSTGTGNAIKVDAKGLGTATITATAENTNITATCEVTVKAKEIQPTIITVKSIKISGNNTIYEGDSTTLKATVTYSEGSTNSSNVTWSSENTNVATVDSKTGKVTGIKAGTAKIKATAGGKTTTYTITVKAKTVKVNSIKLNYTTFNMVPNSTINLTATINPSNATNKSIKWKTNNSNIASIASTGNGNSIKVTAKAAGTATITATASDNTSITAKCTITVKSKNQGGSQTHEVQPTTVTVTDVKILGSSTVYKGNTTKLIAVATYSNGSKNSNNITWSSTNSNIASVNSSGVVTGIKNGTVLITAKVGGKTAQHKISVKDIAVSGVKLNYSSYKMYTNSSFTLTATISPSNATNKNIKWVTSNSNVATIASTGNGNSIKVTGKGVGTTTITARTENSNLVATCKVTVVAKPKTVHNIQISGADWTYVGNTLKMIPLVTFTDGTKNTTTKVTWSSSNSNIATINASTGEVVCKKVGTVKLQAKYGGKTATHTLTVKSRPVTKISIYYKEAGKISTKTSYDLKYNQTLQLYATVTPSNATNNKVTWKSSNPTFVTVSSTGLVKTIKKLPLIHINNQKTIITATANGKTAQFIIYPKR